MKRSKKLLLGALIILLLCGIAINSYASLDSLIARDAFGIHTYTSGVLLYDSKELQPRYGPDFKYQSDYRFEMKKGSFVRVFTITEKDGYQWALVEGSYNNMKSVWIYLLCYDPSRGKLIEIETPGKVISEGEPNYSVTECDYEDYSIRLGPGEQFPYMGVAYNSIRHPYVIGTCQGWALIELPYEDDAADNPSFFRGWIPKDVINQY